jgi:hypothetical protein
LLRGNELSHKKERKNERKKERKCIVTVVGIPAGVETRIPPNTGQFEKPE